MESAVRFGQPHARLFPLIGRRVLTPRGRGLLLQVAERAAAVRLDLAHEVSFFDWREVRPCA